MFLLGGAKERKSKIEFLVTRDGWIYGIEIKLVKQNVY